jgi:hypothetical protein
MNALRVCLLSGIGWRGGGIVSELLDNRSLLHHLLADEERTRSLHFLNLVQKLLGQ